MYDGIQPCIPPCTTYYWSIHNILGCILQWYEYSKRIFWFKTWLLHAKFPLYRYMIDERVAAKWRPKEAQVHIWCCKVNIHLFLTVEREKPEPDTQISEVISWSISSTWDIIAVGRRREFLIWIEHNWISWYGAVIRSLMATFPREWDILGTDWKNVGSSIVK